MSHPKTQTAGRREEGGRGAGRGGLPSPHRRGARPRDGQRRQCECGGYSTRRRGLESGEEERGEEGKLPARAVENHVVCGGGGREWVCRVSRDTPQRARAQRAWRGAAAPACVSKLDEWDEWQWERGEERREGRVERRRGGKRGEQRNNTQPARARDDSQICAAGRPQL